MLINRWEQCFIKGLIVRILKGKKPLLYRRDVVVHRSAPRAEQTYQQLRAFALTPYPLKLRQRIVLHIVVKRVDMFIPFKKTDDCIGERRTDYFNHCFKKII